MNQQTMMWLLGGAVALLLFLNWGRVRGAARDASVALRDETGLDFTDTFVDRSPGLPGFGVGFEPEITTDFRLNGGTTVHRDKQDSWLGLDSDLFEPFDPFNGNGQATLPLDPRLTS